jgi:hypothetical protein
MEENQEKKIKLNEQYLTESEFEVKKREVKNMKGAQLVEVAPNEYKIRLQD